MGQSALILAVAATLTILILLVVVVRNTKDTDSELAQYQFKVLAREVASTGINVTVRRLVDEPYKWSDPTWPYGFTDEPYRGGTFTTTVTGVGVMVPNFYGSDQDTVDVVSVGSITTSGGDTTHVIEARYIKGYEDLGLPPAYRKAMYADSALTLHGKATVQSADTTQNASIHANEVLSAKGSPIDVDGYGTVSNDPPGDYSGVKPNAEAIFDPNDPDGGPLVYADDPIYLPPLDAGAIDAEYHENLDAHVHIETGGTVHTLSGDTLRVSDYASEFECDCGTAENPLLYYVDGDLDIGNVVLEGYVRFVVAGDITFNGSVTSYADADGDGISDPEPDKATQPAEWEAWMQGQLENGENTTIGYWAEGDVTANGNFSVVGQISANGDVTLNGGGGGEVNIIGGVVSTEGSITVNGGVNIRFAMLHERTLLPGLNYVVPDGVILIAWAEW